MESTREGKFGLKYKEKFGDVIFDPKLENMQANISTVMNNFYTKN